MAWVYVDHAPGNFGSCTKGMNCCYLKNEVTPQSAKPICSSGTVTKPADSTVPPPLGMRSAVPLGGLSAGSVELRADGTLHEWTIVNQSPAGAAKFGLQDDAMFGVYAAQSGAAGVAKPVRTMPPASLNGTVQGVDALRYQGAQPVTRLDILDADLPVEASLYGYSTVSDRSTTHCCSVECR